MNNNRNRGFRPGRRRSKKQNNNIQNINVDKLIKKAVINGIEKPVYVPQNKFQDFKISEQLRNNIITKGYVDPTPIQDQTINHILEGKDIVGIANTGTGKTGAFLIPLLDKVYRDKSQKVLIIAPTRELAEQINNELYSLTKYLQINSVLCVGGVNIGGQIQRLRYQHNFVVGTPGRIKDLMSRNILNLSQFQNIVLDEVDRMLDMGFIHDIRFIISKLAEQRQSLFFSATITPEIEKLISIFAKNYVKVSVRTGETTDNVHQDVIRVKDHSEKISKLEELLSGEELKKAIIFVKTKYGVDKLDQILYKKGYRVDCIHGNKTQSRRKKALDAFKKGHNNILVATDVAARGIDVPDITHVINYDMPATYEDYVHRIGRTGRADKTGIALTFVEEKQR